jgi:hypothetical protein
MPLGISLVIRFVRSHIGRFRLGGRPGAEETLVKEYLLTHWIHFQMSWKRILMRELLSKRLQSNIS